ncbi:MAG TPA: collagen-like protein, partial [Solirubrobacteraceae bacterium]|nr:collagen-like protein [Solirubrobacteraceae bacterium]
TDGGETWSKQLALGTDLTSVSCSSITLCLTADTEGNVTAFDPSSLAVWISGQGTVSSDPPGLSCLGETCAGSFEGMVELEARPAAGFAFAGWLGCQRISATNCDVTVSGATEVTAVFVKEAETPVIAPFEGDQHGCANGGLEVTVAGHTTYVCDGADGANGASGQEGAPGKEGPRGNEGSPGKEGAQGPPGPASKVTCKVKRESKQKVNVTCTVTQSASSARVHLRWRLTRNGHTVSHGTSTGTLRLDLRHLHRGRYLLYIQGQRRPTAVVVA